jgi:hypothetical protein
VQAPQSPEAQPSLVPIKFCWLRRYCKSVVSAAASATSTETLFTANRTDFSPLYRPMIPGTQPLIGYSRFQLYRLLFIISSSPEAKVWPNRQFFMSFLTAQVFHRCWHAICSNLTIFLSR